MLKAFLGEQCDEELLRQVGVRVLAAFLDQEPCTFRRANQRVRRDDPMQLDPDLVNVRVVKAIVPFPDLDLPGWRWSVSLSCWLVASYEGMK